MQLSAAAAGSIIFHANHIDWNIDAIIDLTAPWIWALHVLKLWKVGTFAVLFSAILKMVKAFTGIIMVSGDPEMDISMNQHLLENGIMLLFL